eukprot:g44191.t1
MTYFVASFSSESLLMGCGINDLASIYLPFLIVLEKVVVICFHELLKSTWCWYAHSAKVQQIIKKANGILFFIACGMEFKNREIMLQLYRVL